MRARARQFAQLGEDRLLRDEQDWPGTSPGEPESESGVEQPPKSRPAPAADDHEAGVVLVSGRQQGLEFMSVHRLPPLASTPNAGFPELADGALEAVVVIPQAARFGRRPAAWHVAAPHVEREHLPARSGRKVGGSSKRRG